MTKYVCKVLFDGGVIFVESNRGIADFMHGFWINADMEFTAASDCRFWIPPSRIMHIEKICEE